MQRKLTRQDKVGAEQSRISKLTNDHTELFKIIFSHQIEKNYQFKSLHDQKKAHGLKQKDLAGIFYALGKFIDKTMFMSMSEVESKYGKTPYKADTTWDPEAKIQVKVEHFCLYLEEDDPKKHSDSVRLHGYFRDNGGYFVLTRLDWFHGYGNK